MNIPYERFNHLIGSIKSLIQEDQPIKNMNEDLIIECIIKELMILYIKEPSFFGEMQIEFYPYQDHPREWIPSAIIDIAKRYSYDNWDQHYEELLKEKIENYFERSEISKELPDETKLLREIARSKGEWVKIIKRKTIAKRLQGKGLIEIEGQKARINPLLKDLLERVQYRKG